MTRENPQVGDRVRVRADASWENQVVEGRIRDVADSPESGLSVVWIACEEGGCRAYRVSDLDWLDESPTNPKDLIARTKPNLSLIPGPAKVQVALALMNGAEKYGPYNWREKKIEIMTYLSAAERHIAAYRDGEECAIDSGIHHIAHACAGLMILLDALACEMVVDNRPKSAPTGKMMDDASTPSHPLTLRDML